MAYIRPRPSLEVAVGRIPVVPRVPCDAPWIERDAQAFVGVAAHGGSEVVAAPCEHAAAPGSHEVSAAAMIIHDHGGKSIEPLFTGGRSAEEIQGLALDGFPALQVEAKGEVRRCKLLVGWLKAPRFNP